MITVLSPADYPFHTHSTRSSPHTSTRHLHTLWNRHKHNRWTEVLATLPIASTRKTGCERRKQAWWLPLHPPDNRCQCVHCRDFQQQVDRPVSRSGGEMTSDPEILKFCPENSHSPITWIKPDWSAIRKLCCWTSYMELKNGWMAKMAFTPSSPSLFLFLSAQL